jgi:hypothetical protein
VIDSFVLLTPLLMLGVIALVRFVGCNQVFGLEPTVTAAPPVTHLVAVPGDQRVDLTWDYEPGNATAFEIWYHEANVGSFVMYAGAQIHVETIQGQAQHGSASVGNLANGTKHFFKVLAHTANSSSSLAATLPVESTPGVTEFLSFTTLGTIRNNFTGWVGMAVQMNADAIVTQLGRLVVANNVRMHDIRIVDPGQGYAVLGAVTVNMPAGPIGTFAYRALPQPVALNKYRLYYFMTHEEIGGDDFHDIMPVDTTGIGTIISGVYSDDAAPNTYLSLGGSMNQTYGPVNFTY